MGIMEPLSRDHVKRMIDIVSAYCGSSSNNEFCPELLKQLENSSELIARIRLRDLSMSDRTSLEDYEGLDKNIFTFIKKIIGVYAYHISGKYLVTDSGNVLVKVKRGFRYPPKNIQLIEGDYTFLSFSDSVIFTALGLVEPVESSITSIRYSEEQIFNA
jgi:hypothetical protein